MRIHMSRSSELRRAGSKAPHSAKTSRRMTIEEERGTIAQAERSGGEFAGVQEILLRRRKGLAAGIHPGAGGADGDEGRAETVEFTQHRGQEAGLPAIVRVEKRHVGKTGFANAGIARGGEPGIRLAHRPDARIGAAGTDAGRVVGGNHRRR